MPRSSEARAISALTKTSGAATVTAAAGTFDPTDAGRGITGTGIPAATTILSVQSGTAATLSANASASNSAAATIAADSNVSAAIGFRGWSPESGDEAGTYTVAANNANTATPDRISNTYTARSEGRRARQ